MLLNPKLNLTLRPMKGYVGDQRLVQMGFRQRFKTRNPFSFMLLQDTRPFTNFFEKRVTEYQKGLKADRGDIVFDSVF